MSAALSLALSAFVMSAILCGLIVKLGPVDAPDGERKMQARAVPTSGGLAVLVGTAAVCAMAVFIGNIDLMLMSSRLLAWGWWPHLLLIAGASAIGFIDDWRGLGARLKLVLLAVLCLFAAGAGFHAELFSMAGNGLASFLVWSLCVAGSALWLFVIMNAANFMDGSNGLAIGSLLVMLASLAAFWMQMESAGAAPIVVLGVMALLGAMAGFLVWNLGGRLYAGDAGALGIGAVFGSLSLFVVSYMSETGEPRDVSVIWFPATLALPFLVDVFMTLLWRNRRGAPLLSAHTEHAYQFLRAAGWGHLGVALLWWSFAVICGVAGLFAASSAQDAGFPVFAGLLAAGILLWILQRRSGVPSRPG